VRAADGHDDGDDPPQPIADERPRAHLLRSAHLTPLQCDFQLSSTTARRAPPPPNVRCIQTLAKWSQVSEFSFTITDQLSSTVRSVNWSDFGPPPPPLW
jgi:hypothetical protein